MSRARTVSIACARCGDTVFYPNSGGQKYCNPCRRGPVQHTQARAISVVNAAVRSGALPPVETQYCIDCGRFAVAYDHRDYSRPLDVVPVCHGCNKKRGPVRWSLESVAA